MDDAQLKQIEEAKKLIREQAGNIDVAQITDAIQQPDFEANLTEALTTEQTEPIGDNLTLIETPEESMDITEEQKAVRRDDAQSTLDMLNQSDKETLDLLDEQDGEAVVKDHVKTNMATEGEVTDEESGAVTEAMKKLWYYRWEIDRGLRRGALQAFTTASSYLGEVTGWDTLADYSKKGEDVIEDVFATTSVVGDISETGGRLGVGLVATKGLGGSTLGWTARGAVTDMTVFSGDEGNIADVAVQYGFENELTDFLKTDGDDTETTKRFKNALTGAGFGASIDGVIATIKYGKVLFSKTGIKFNGTDKELADHVLKLVDDDAKNLMDKQIDEVQPPNVPASKAPVESLDPEVVQQYIGGKGEAHATASRELDDALKVVEGDYEGFAIRGMLDTEGTLGKLGVGDNYTTRGTTSIAKDKETADTFVNRSWDEGASGDKVYVTFESFLNKPVNLGTGNKLGFDDVLNPTGAKHSFLEDEVVIPSGRNFEVVKKEVKDGEIHLIVKEVDEAQVKPVASEVLSDITHTVKVDINAGIKMFEDAENFIAGVKSEVDMKQPLNAEKLADGSESFAKATEGVESDFTVLTHAETIKRVDDALRIKIGDESYDLMDDMMKTSTKLENITTDLGQARVIVGTLAKALDDSIKVAQKDNSVSSMIIVLQNMKNLNTSASILKNTQSQIAQAMSSMRISTANSEMMGTLKLLDAIDPENAMLRLEQSIGKGDIEDLTKFMDDLSDTTKGLKEKIENVQDSWYKKITNALSEGVVAGMLSAPTTTAVNVIGNSFVKHQAMMQDTLQFVYGQTFRASDRMALREYKLLMQASVGQNIYDMGKIMKNMGKWGKSGFKDEVFDDAVLIKFKQDQDFAHKYIDSKYLRGKEAGANGAFNNAINVTGKIARSPYNIIGYVDDYYKRGAFRTELVRQGSRLARAKGIPADKYNEFMNKFIQANTELRMMTNANKTPNKVWLSNNQEYVGTGIGITKYTDQATEFANIQTFQKDLGDGLVGKSVKMMNSDGLLRILVPFKMTPINILKKSASIATDPIRVSLYKDIAKGGIKRDIAMAKITTSVAIMTGLASMATSGHMTGTFTDKERQAMASAGIPELSYRIGDKWYEYKQIEPLATIAGVMTDMYKLTTNLSYRLEDAELTDTLQEEYKSVMADLALSLVHNITDKAYTKSLADSLQLVTGEADLVDYSGKLISSATPMSSLTNYIGRVTNDGFKKEAVTFMEKVKSKYRWALERDALDAYGRPMSDVQYLFGVTIKSKDANAPEDKGSREVARLGIELKKLPKTVSHMGFPAHLTPEQHWKMRRSLDTKFNLADRLNTRVESAGYRNANDDIRLRMLKKTISKVQTSAMKYIKIDLEVQTKIKKQAELVKADVKRKKGSRTTYNSLVIDKVE